jgi:WD40 repeat protein
MRFLKICPPGFPLDWLAVAVLLAVTFLGGCRSAPPTSPITPQASQSPNSSDTPFPLSPTPLSPASPVPLSPTPLSPTTPTPTFTPQITPSPWSFERSFGPWEQVLSLAWSPDGELLAVAAGEHVYILDGSTFHLQGTLEVGSWSDHLAFSPVTIRNIPYLLAVAAKDSQIQLWDASLGKQLIAWDAHQKGAKSVSFSSDGARLASTGGDAMLRLWDVPAVLDKPSEEPDPLAEMIGGAYAIPDASFSPDGSLVASVDVHDIRLRDPSTQRLVRTLRGDTSIFRIAFSPDGLQLAAAEMGNKLSLWDVEGGQLIGSWSASGGQAGDAQIFLWGLAFSPDGSRLAAGGSDGMVTEWDSATGQVLERYQAHSQAVTSLAFSPDGALLASGSLDGVLRLWEK